jgi:hypothetical protein
LPKIFLWQVFYLTISFLDPFTAAGWVFLWALTFYPTTANTVILTVSIASVGGQKLKRVKK